MGVKAGVGVNVGVNVSVGVEVWVCVCRRVHVSMRSHGMFGPYTESRFEL